ncbi:vWA domain-containing protein [Gulosibacter hominis]|uniref:vWA domain-containing protein n=1 Tax=Gulosibacter hominis TaxID=2770504 RepID=UPI00191A640E|nr:VWA domain-containing protein [Gulosibacter hominis]
MSLVLWWVPIVVLVLLVAVIISQQLFRPGHRKTGTPIANSARLTRLPEYDRAVRKASKRVWFALIAAVLSLVVATIGGARWVYTNVVTPEKYNRDIVLCLDVSGSMVDYDAKVIDRYLEMLPGFDGERMSLVVWNSSAVPIFPLTDDYAFVKEQLEQMRDAMESGGYSEFVNVGTLEKPGASLVGDGLASCVMQFEGAAPSTDEEPIDDGRSRSIILATDNQVNGEQTVTLPEALQYARHNSISVYGLDANENQDAYAEEYRISLENNGGTYFALTDGTQVDTIVDTITSEQTSLIRGAPQLTITDRPEVWLWLLLGGTAIYLTMVWRSRL